MQDDMSNSETDFKFYAQKIPTEPGCYLFWSAEDELLYVGKAKNLRNRVRNYFQKNDKSAKTIAMVKKIARIETRIVASEMEALILENNLIKKHLPKYNILLRDDKTFLYLRITNEYYPRLEITRRIVRDGSTYIGPHTSAKKFRKMIAFCQKIFRIRTCKLEFDTQGKVIKNPESRKLPCMDFHIKKCSGPCSDDITQADYLAEVEQMKKFLRGETKDVLAHLQERMMNMAKERNFEAAAKLRDLIASISSGTERQRVEFSDTTSQDFINFTREKNQAFFALLSFRHGKLLDQAEVKLKAESWETDSAVLEKFLMLWHERTDDHPSQILIPTELENTNLIEEHLSTKILVPQKGEKMRVLEMAKRNAEKSANINAIEVQAQAEIFSKALPQLAEILGMAEPPRRIECYDISHFGGTATVASQVVFIDGKPYKNEYRRFKMKTLKPGEIDDFKSLREVLDRRIKGLNNTVQREDNSAEYLEKNKPLLASLEELKEILGEIDFWILGGLASAFAIGKFWREHDDIDLLVEKKNWKKFCKALEEAEFEKIENTETFFTFKKKGFPDIDASPLGTELPIGKFTKKNCNPEAFILGETEIKTLNIKTLLKIKQNLRDTRDTPKDQEDINVIEHHMREKSVPHKPDLIVIDGGKGQLSSVLKVLPPEYQNKVISLAKREEEIFLPGQSAPLEVDANSPASKLLQRCRDEAHRFAITFNRSIREKTATKSILDDINGIGGTTRKKLLQKFGSVRDIRTASDKDLRTVLSEKQLKELRKNL